MSVLIKGMEKLKSCIWRDGRCPLLGDDDDCKLQDCQEEWTWQDQYKGCPLSDAPDICVGDMISRQAAIDKITEYGSGDVTCMSVGELKRRIEALPSTQPEPCEDAVSRQAAIEALMAWEEYSVWDEECLKHRGEPFWVAPSDVIKQLPPAQPEQRWIPCTDPTKLPKNKELWITCEICGCRVLKEIYWDMTEWSDDVSGLIAYMPYVKPEPYREEGD